MDSRVEELICKVADGCATAEEEEELQAMSAKDPEIGEELRRQRQTVSAIRSVGLREWQDDETERFARGVYNRLECKTGWVLVAAGLAALGGYTLYEIVTDPGLDTVFRVGLVAVVIGFGLLLSNAWRCRARVSKRDPYREVQR